MPTRTPVDREETSGLSREDAAAAVALWHRQAATQVLLKLESPWVRSAALMLTRTPGALTTCSAPGDDVTSHPPFGAASPTLLPAPLTPLLAATLDHHVNSAFRGRVFGGRGRRPGLRSSGVHRITALGYALVAEHEPLAISSAAAARAAYACAVDAEVSADPSDDGTLRAWLSLRPHLRSQPARRRTTHGALRVLGDGTSDVGALALAVWVRGNDERARLLEQVRTSARGSVVDLAALETALETLAPFPRPSGSPESTTGTTGTTGTTASAGSVGGERTPVTQRWGAAVSRRLAWHRGAVLLVALDQRETPAALAALAAADALLDEPARAGWRRRATSFESVEPVQASGQTQAWPRTTTGSAGALTGASAGAGSSVVAALHARFEAERGASVRSPLD